MSLKEQAYDYIKDKIIKNEFLPGTGLSENSLTAEIGVSRTPIREALVSLMGEGLVKKVGRLYLVTSLTRADVQEIYELRTLLETYALQKTINSIPDEELNQLIVDFEQAYQDENWDEYLKVDIHLHRLITHVANYPILAQFQQIIRSQVDRTRYINVNSKTRMARSIVEHKEIIKWIKERNYAEAKKALEYHLQQVYQEVKLNLNNLR
ncbi:GntR family transcriptional regulator [Lactobacillus psittaci]|uniref:Transcriptional regulator n=1 Tax=Lactobacillus psittaci DSM 15354 TaxID=1122152 RepID=A0A0R1S6Z1_9LACO|nr:GntR family transcriptional regulator [Lactobacillus psittaci]KRL62024.1 transcriptional regulator [Lactobacillus psittaci DSM 15354]